MNSLILSLAPFSGLASALPAIAAADTRSALRQRPGAPDESRSFAIEDDLEGDSEPGEYDGGYLLL